MVGRGCAVQSSVNFSNAASGCGKPAWWRRNTCTSGPGGRAWAGELRSEDDIRYGVRCAHGSFWPKDDRTRSTGWIVGLWEKGSALAFRKKGQPLHFVILRTSLYICILGMRYTPKTVCLRLCLSSLFVESCFCRIWGKWEG